MVSMKLKKINILILFAVVIFTLSCSISNVFAQHDPGYYLGYINYAPDGTWQCNCPYWQGNPECACIYEG